MFVVKMLPRRASLWMRETCSLIINGKILQIIAEPDESCDMALVITGRNSNWNADEKIERAIGIIKGRRPMWMYNSYSVPPWTDK